MQIRNAAWLIVLILAALFMPGSPLQAGERYALLVGVSDYTEISGVQPLKGPKNDVALMNDALRSIGFPADHIETLANGIDGGTDPSRANIMDAFDRLAGKSRNNDFVVIYLSGHGARQPDQNADEADRYDEVFLPSDIKKARSGTVRKSIENALIDDEIGEAVTTLRKRGADVWLIMDSCFSGTGVRSGNPRIRSRNVSGSALGIGSAPIPLEEKNDTASAAIDNLGPEAGGLMAFYAAQSHEAAKEINFSTDKGDSNAEDGTGWYGLFTSKLALRLQQAGHLTYRQLFQSVLHDMNDFGASGIRGRIQTPYWEGSIADSLPGLPGQGSEFQQYPIQRGTLHAGQLHGLAEGAVFSVVADPSDPADGNIGYVQINFLDLLTSDVRPVGADCLEQEANKSCPHLSAAMYLENARFARLQVPILDLVLRLSLPYDLDCGRTGRAEGESRLPIARDGGKSCRPSEHKPLLKALKGIEDLPADKLGLTIQFSETDYDLAVGFKDRRIWFGDDSGFDSSGTANPSHIAWPDRRLENPEYDIRVLRDMIHRIGKARNLLAFQAAVEAAAAQTISRQNPVEITARLRRSDKSKLEADISHDYYRPDRECKKANRTAGAPEPLMQSANLFQCDSYWFEFHNKSAKSFDINTIYIDANYGIDVESFRLDGSILQKTRTTVNCSDCPAQNGAAGIVQVVGPETVVILVSEAIENADKLDLSYLEQSRIETATRSGAAGGLLSELIEGTARPGAKTRGSINSEIPEVWASSFHWRVWPREIAATKMVPAN